MPFEGAQLLQRELEQGNVSPNSEAYIRLSDLYTQAREYKRAIAPLEQAAKSGGSNDKLYARLGEALYQDKQCERSETALRRAVELGYDHGKAWSLIGACYYEKAQASPRLSCAMTDAEIASAPRTTYREKAKAAYQTVRPNDKLVRDAKAWTEFIDGEKAAFMNRCSTEFDGHLKDICFYKWEKAFQGQAFTGGKPIMDDPKCMDYKDDYIAKFRPSEALRD